MSIGNPIIVSRVECGPLNHGGLTKILFYFQLEILLTCYLNFIIQVPMGLIFKILTNTGLFMIILIISSSNNKYNINFKYINLKM